MTPAAQRTFGRVLIGLAILIVLERLLEMFRVIPKVSPPLLAYVALLIAIVGKQLYRRGARG